MEDTFRVRVDKAFGSLTTASTSTAAPSASANLSSLWSLTDEEIERDKWNRDKGTGSPEPESQPGPLSLKTEAFGHNSDSSEVGYGWNMEKDLDDLDDEEEEEEETVKEKEKEKPDDHNDEEWEIRNNIGMDSTLDDEDEEDEFDKVAVGKGKAKDGDRLYVKGMDDYGIDMDSSNVLPNSFAEVTKDPRANHIAAKIRLKEDAEAAKNMDKLRVFDDGNLKSIVRSREGELDSKMQDVQSEFELQKRIRFEAECEDDDSEETSRGKDIQMDTDSTEVATVYPVPSDYPSGIPDYMRNPSKYTRYTFDSSDLDEKSNRQAYMDFLTMLKKSKDTESLTDDDAPFDRTKPLSFVPKKKTGNATMIHSTQTEQGHDHTGKQSRRKSIAIAVTPTEDSEIDAMEEDERQTDRINSSLRQGRRYRAKTELDRD